jgi:lipoate synthase
VFAQNVETVRRLTHPVRDPRAGYDQTLAVLAHAKRHRPAVLTKTSLMLGLGETDAEVLETMDDLRAAGVDLLTLGQYLRPTANHLPVARFVTPTQFDAVPRRGARARLPRMRLRAAGALELSRRACAAGQQRGLRKVADDGCVSA